MYAQLVKSEGSKHRDEMTPQELAFQDRIDRGKDRTEGMDAGRVSQDPDPSDRPTRAF